MKRVVNYEFMLTQRLTSGEIIHFTVWNSVIQVLLTTIIASIEKAMRIVATGGQLMRMF